MKGIALIALLASASVLSGCGTTTATGHLNPTHANYRLSYVAVVVEPRTEVSDQVEARLVESLTQQGIKAYKTSDITRFAEDPGEAGKQIFARGGSEMLAVDLQDDAGRSWGGAMSQGRVVGDSVTVVTTPVAAYNRLVRANVAVYTIEDDRAVTLMKGVATHDGVGLYSATDGSIIPGIVDGVMQSLEASGVITR